MNIVFAHNVYKRHKQMIKTINNNRQFIDDDKMVVVSNDYYYSYFNYTKVTKMKFKQLFRNKGHKLGSLESMIIAMKNAIKFKSEIIIFSHDDVYINNYKLLLENFKRLDSKSIIVRRPIQPDENYFMYDAFIIKTEVAKRIFSQNIKLNNKIIPLDYLNRPCPEIYFGNLILNSMDKKLIHIFNYDHETWGNTELGFYHMPGRNWTETKYH